MSFGKYLKDVKAQIREVDLETVRKTVEARKGKSGDGNGAGPILGRRPRKGRVDRGLYPRRPVDPARFSRVARRRPDPRAVVRVILYCAGGTRSALAAAFARRARLHQRQVEAGGFGAWKRAACHSTARSS